MEYRTLGSTGIEISTLGFGAATLGDIYGAIDPKEGIRAIRHAVDQGITLVDTAPYYGQTLAETRLGEALDGIRERVVLSTKCCRYGFDDFDFSRESVMTSLEASLKRLRTDHLDLFIAHDVEFGDRAQVVDEAVPALLEAKAQGKVRAVGVSGLPLQYLRSVATEGDVDFVLSYCHYNLLCDDLDDVLVPWAAETNKGLINASPLHMGILSPDGPPDWHTANGAVKETGREIIELCAEHDIHPACVTLRMSLDHPAINSTLVGMKTRDEVDKNLAVFELTNDPKLLAEIDQLIGPVKNDIWPEGRPENNP